MTRGQLQQRLKRIKAQLLALGPIHPGALSTQYNVCGTPGCRCKDLKNPRRHGPYHQLSYTWRRRSRTRFIREPQLEAMQEKLTNYKRFRELTAEWVDVAVALEAAERQATRSSR